MVEEFAVFDGHHGVVDVGGDGVETDPLAAFHIIFMGDFPVHVVDVRDEARVDLLQLGKRGQFGREVHVSHDDGDEAQQDGDKQDEQPLDDFPVGKELFQELENHVQDGLDFFEVRKELVHRCFFEIFWLNLEIFLKLFFCFSRKTLDKGAIYAIFGANLADVAQLDRAFGYEPKGSRFESWHPQK